MFLKGLAVDQDIIDECNRVLIYTFTENIVYKSLEGSRSISKSERYYLIFIGSVSGSERC
jgi:hypothetical protein